MPASCIKKVARNACATRASIEPQAINLHRSKYLFLHQTLGRNSSYKPYRADNRTDP